MIRPLPGFVLIEPIEDEGKSAGGVYLPESAKDKPSKGRIVEISPIIPIETKSGFIGIIDEVRDRNDSLIRPSYADEMRRVEKGVVVIYKKWTNQEVEDKGKKYLLVKFDELLGIIE